MSTPSPFDPSNHSLSDTAEEAIQDFSSKAKDVAQRATETARELYQTAALKAEETLATSKNYVHRNPVPVFLGAIALGAAIGYMIVKAQRKPSFGERFAEEPLDTVRQAIFSALAPVTQRVHEGYDSARDGVENAIDHVHQFGYRRGSHSMSDRIGRVVSNIKFW